MPDDKDRECEVDCEEEGVGLLTALAITFKDVEFKFIGS